MHAPSARMQNDNRDAPEMIPGVDVRIERTNELPGRVARRKKYEKPSKPNASKRRNMRVRGEWPRAKDE